MTVLIDTSILLAAAIQKDIHHQDVVQMLRGFGSELQIVVTPVLNEMFQILAIRTHYEYAITRLEEVEQGFHVEPPTTNDVKTMVSMMRRYKSNEFDFADVAIMAIAERLKIRRIATLDRRDFSVYRLPHCDYFELLP